MAAADSSAENLQKLIATYENVSKANKEQIDRVSGLIRQIQGDALECSAVQQSIPLPASLPQGVPVETPATFTEIQPSTAMMGQPVSVPAPMPVTSPMVSPARRKSSIPGWSIPPRVLLVDDDLMFRRISTKLLQVAGCIIDVAADGLEAITKLNAGSYDIVLMVR